MSSLKTVPFRKSDRHTQRHDGGSDQFLAHFGCDATGRKTRTPVAFDVPALGIAEPLVANVSLQLFAYHVANEKGRPIDKPRNLAKSVTVE